MKPAKSSLMVVAAEKLLELEKPVHNSEPNPAKLKTMQKVSMQNIQTLAQPLDQLLSNLGLVQNQSVGEL